MGCNASKPEDLPLVARCRERRDLIRAAANHRYALAAAHVSYFSSLKDVGEALRKFVDEEIVTMSSSASPPSSSPSLILPSNTVQKNDNGGGESPLEIRGGGGGGEEEHLHSTDSDSEEQDSEELNHRNRNWNRNQSDSHQVHNRHSALRHLHKKNESSPPYPDPNPYSYPSMYPNPTTRSPWEDSQQPWLYSTNSMAYYMKSAPATKTVVHEPPSSVPMYGYADSYWHSPAIYSDNNNSNNSYSYFSIESRAPINNEGVRLQPPPPSPPVVSPWDFFNPFDMFDSGYTAYDPNAKYGYGSYGSSPDSNEVREREGIPDLEEETESDVYKEDIAKVPTSDSKSALGHRNGSTSTSAPVQLRKSEPSRSSEEIEKPSPPPDAAVKPSIPPRRKGKSSRMDRSPILETAVSTTDGEITAEISAKTTEVEGTEIESSAAVSTSPNGGSRRDLREVVAEIRDEFEIASSYGKEVAMMLEVGKVQYQPSFFKVMLSRILYSISPSLSSSDPASPQPTKSSSNKKSGVSLFEDVGKDVNLETCNLSSTLDKLYAWEKKLYKEVKNEEELRVAYEKQCKKLNVLDEEGADSGKIDAARTSIRKLLTKLDVSIKAIDTISNRIHKLRDEELQPQVASLIFGLIRMWKAMLKCHQKQFQAIMESKMRKLRANTSLQASTTHASTELERELREWCARFNDWVFSQKSYVEALNGWLLHCLQYEPEETPDGPVPYSPSRLGAPPIFVICNDWQQAMEAVSEARVANALNMFATNLRGLWENQDEEGRQRLREEYEKRKGKIEESTGLSMVGVSTLDDLDLDFERMKKHKEAMKLYQGGLVPIFKALENFTSEALKAHQHVRLQESV